LANPILQSAFVYLVVIIAEIGKPTENGFAKRFMCQSW
jgi:hypothetical protein